MDDKDSLRFATDCSLHDSATSDASCDQTDTYLQLESGATSVAEAEDSSDFDAGPDECLQEPSADVEPTVDAEGETEDGPEVTEIIEAVLFSSDTPLSASRLAGLVGDVTPSIIRRQIATLNGRYERFGLSFRIEAIARGYQMMTLASFRPWVAKLNIQRRETRLSAAALETLSVVAYKQPIIRADVEAVRGVACGEVISRLRDMGLVRVLGRADVVGRPLIYGTTKRFLDVFGLVDLDDLPPMEALRLKPTSKPAEEVEPVSPPALPTEPIEQCAAVG